MKTEIARIPRRKRRTYWRSGVSPLPPDAGTQNNPASQSDVPVPQGVPARYDYAPFGAVTASGDVPQPFQWSSEFYDSELGLVYYNYRHYSPTDGRWLSRDPIEEQGGLNLYAFCSNNPADATDREGMDTCRCPFEFDLGLAFFFESGVWYGVTFGEDGRLTIIEGENRKTDDDLWRKEAPSWPGNNDVSIPGIGPFFRICF